MHMLLSLIKQLAAGGAKLVPAGFPVKATVSFGES